MYVVQYWSQPFNSISLFHAYRNFPHLVPEEFDLFIRSRLNFKHSMYHFFSSAIIFSPTYPRMFSIHRLDYLVSAWRRKQKLVHGGYLNGSSVFLRIWLVDFYWSSVGRCVSLLCLCSIDMLSSTVQNCRSTEKQSGYLYLSGAQ